jgi:gliding motility-associated-like protein
VKKLARLLLLFITLTSIHQITLAQVDASYDIDTNLVKSYAVRFVSNYELADTLNYTFLWEFGDGENSHLPVIEHLYDEAGTYFTSFTVSDNSFSDYSFKKVTVRNVVRAPNVFTPNGDGINDFWVVRTNGKSKYTVSVFTPSGSKVFEMSSYTISWDGKNPGGKDLSPGVYYYVISLDDKYMDTGFFHLIR